MGKKRIVTKIGDVFRVDKGNGKVKYFQYIANDISQLNSSVIRAFTEEYDKEEKINFETVVKGDVQFHAHCVLRAGIQRGLWEKVG